MEDNNNLKLGRRRLVLRVGTLGVVGLGAAACVPAQPVYVQPGPPVVVRGTGITDADPNDGPGNGRGGYRGGGTGITDADPNDGPGRGRGGYRGGGYRTGTGITDSDPNDGPGRGRGGARVYRGGSGSGVTDSDPSDGPGRGRRGY
jgi:hypothetical protein